MPRAHRRCRIRARVQGVLVNALTPDLAAAQRFLTLLGEGEDFTLQTFDDSGNRNKSLARIFHTQGGEVQTNVWQTLIELNQQGAGIFVTVNRTDGHGRKTENVVSVRAAFVDLDGPPLSVLDKALLPPHIVVATSPGRYHAYWIIEGLTPEQFPAVQQALAKRYGGDPAVKDLPRVMRLPGFYHRKRAPFLVRILSEECSQPYDAATFRKTFAIEPTQTQHAQIQIPAGTSTRMVEGSRNTHLASLAGSMRRRGMSPSAVEAALQEENRVNCDPPLSGQEVSSITQSICRYAPGSPDPIEAFKIDSLKQLDARTAIQMLAGLDTMIYEQHRKAASKLLGLRPRILDSEVERLRTKKAAPASLQGTAIQFDDPESWPEPVDTALLLDDLTTMIRRFVALEEREARSVAFWILATHHVERADCAPILAVTSPEKRCGKTTLLTILGQLVARPLLASSITPATTFRVIEKYRPTLLIDEADTFLKENEELRGILNSGHTPASAYVFRSVGDEHEPRRFSTFGFKAIACIGSLPSTLADRSIEIRLRRRQPNEHVQKLREAEPAEWDSLRRCCARFTQDTAAQFAATPPAIPTELNDRAADNWSPLLTVAELAGSNWPRMAAQAALALSKEQDQQSTSTRLLADIRTVFDDDHAQELTTQKILERLAGVEESGWDSYNHGKPLTARQLASRLKTYGIRSVKLRPEGGTPGTRGYRRKDFSDVWYRYLPGIPSATTPQATISRGSGANASATSENAVADQMSPQPGNDAGCGAEADSEPRQRRNFV